MDRAVIEQHKAKMNNLLAARDEESAAVSVHFGDSGDRKISAYIDAVRKFKDALK